MRYTVQYSILKYLLDNGLLTREEFDESDKFLKERYEKERKSRKDDEFSKRYLTSGKSDDILLTVEKNTEETGDYQNMSKEADSECRAAVYCRTCGSDDVSDIESQKETIKCYCENNGITVIETYTDVNFSGNNMDRPDFNRMIADIIAGHINCVITSDLSRIGRSISSIIDCFAKFFPERKVRIIAVKDKIDSIYVMPFVKGIIRKE